MPKKKHWHAPSLHEVLASVGFTSIPGDFGRRRIFDADAHEVFSGTAGETWQWLRDEHIHSMCRECCRDHTDVELNLEGVCEDCHGELARAADREQRIADYEAHCDHLRDLQKDGVW